MSFSLILELLDANFNIQCTSSQALRAGTVDRENPYRLALPSSWREKQVGECPVG